METSLNSRRNEEAHSDYCGHNENCEPRFPYGGRGHRDPVAGTPAIAVCGLSARYPSAIRNALTSVSITVNRGERMALLGANGAGKSTLLKAIAGLVVPLEGDIRLLGNPVGACHHRTVYLPQKSSIDWKFPMTVTELVMTGRYVHLGWFVRPRKDDYTLVSAAIERLGITRFSDARIGELSGGQQQRVLLARALVQGAEILLLDEPLNAVDEETRSIVDDVLAAEANRGCAVLLATHDTGSLTESFDRVIGMSDGRVIYNEVPSAIRGATEAEESEFSHVRKLLAFRGQG
ncbi:MAG: ABC transporter ATP-binding protein [Planctomyces sp.]|nr:ABC transporter ATP-binding protein [Planctomyces sp.]